MISIIKYKDILYLERMRYSYAYIKGFDQVRDFHFNHDRFDFPSINFQSMIDFRNSNLYIDVRVNDKEYFSSRAYIAFDKKLLDGGHHS